MHGDSPAYPFRTSSGTEITSPAQFGQMLAGALRQSGMARLTDSEGQVWELGSLLCSWVPMVPMAEA